MLPIRLGITNAIGRFRPKDMPEIAAMLEQLPIGGTAIDIGAATGQYTKQMSRGVGSKGRVIAIEPQTDLASMLADLYRSNNRIRVRHSELVAVAGSMTDTEHNEHARSAQNRPISLCEIPFEYALRRIDFIRCALAGGELAFLESGFSVINKYKPGMLIELINQSPDSELPERLWSIFRTLDYKGQCFRDGVLVDINALDEPVSPESNTLLFTHPHKQNMLIR